MSRTKTATPQAAADFDENTPPPRGRPRGSPAPRFLDLPPGEAADSHFLDWDAKGRIPEGSILAIFSGTACGPTRGTGYRRATGSEAPLTEAEMESLRIVSVVVQHIHGRREFAILAERA